MRKLFKFSANTIIAGAIACSVVPAASAAEGQAAPVASQAEVKFDLTVDQVMADPRYKDLNITAEDARLYKKIELIKKSAPTASVAEVSEKLRQDHFDGQKVAPSALSDYEIIKQWNELTLAEQALAVTSPAAALVVNECRKKAVIYSDNGKYGYMHGNGTKKDAFRHAIWNALMCKYISKMSADAWATAHEQKSEAYFNEYTDGVSNREHTRMDLHNNQKGRDTWSILTDSIFWTSDQDLINRVSQKIDNGEMIVFLPDNYRP
ncbi:DUF6973 domain-containing protein [Paenibacillus elgii]|uniref:DUF6973 domain-containing protein n=1 Tax=Paenibacillus sp. A3 TaxID=1337054 RepID=UPI0006D55DFC|nr:hypothetical protein [Paenibacillus sp. A3]